MRVFCQLLNGRRGWVGLTTFASILSSCLMLLWNARLRALIDALQGTHLSSGRVAGIALLLPAIAIATYALGLCAGWTLESLAHDLRIGFARHIAALPFEEAESLHAGEIVSRLQNEIDDVSVFLRANLFPLLDDAVKFIATYAWLLWLHPTLALLAHVPSFLLIVYTALASRLIEATAMQTQQANTHMNGLADTLTAVFPIVRVFNATALLHRRYCDALEQWQAATRREERRKAALLSLSGALSALPLLSLFAIGGTMAWRGEITLGTLYVFLNLSGNVSGVLMNMPGRLAGFRRFSANMQRLSPHIRLPQARESR